MTTREDFLKALAADEDNLEVRSQYVDWLLDREEYEEAERQRAWPAAKKWLVDFVAAHTADGDGVFERSADGELVRRPYAYADLLSDVAEYAAAADGASPFGIYFPAVGSIDLSNAVADPAVAAEFWKQWAVVAGRPAPTSGYNNGDPFYCAC